MYLVKMINPKIQKEKSRWIKLNKSTYLIKQLTNNEKDKLISSENIDEFYKINRFSLIILKSSENKLLEGMEL